MRIICHQEIRLDTDLAQDKTRTRTIIEREVKRVEKQVGEAVRYGGTITSALRVVDYGQLEEYDAVGIRIFQTVECSFRTLLRMARAGIRVDKSPLVIV